ncbi:MAG: HAD family hydrolase [Candidatus Anammoxibacter sp.]
MQLDLIIFDLDGTLINSKDDIANAVNHMLTELGLNRIENKIIYSYVGKGVPKLVERSLTEKHLDKFDEAVSLFKKYYAEHLLDITTLYPNVKDILNHFRNKKKAVVTNKDQSYSLPILKELGIFNCFDKLLYGDSVANKKPHPEAIYTVIKELEVGKNRSLMVGDTNADITAGKNAKIHTCGLTYGFGSKEELQTADAELIIDDIIDLKRHFS